MRADICSVSELAHFETPERLASYRITKHKPSFEHQPDPVVVVASIERGADIVTYNVSVLNFSMQLILCNLPGSAPSRDADLGNGAYGQVRMESWAGRKFAVKRQNAIKSYGPQCAEQMYPELIEDVLAEYALTKICSFYGIGPQVDATTGFDILCYSDCLEFGLELCRAATKEDIINGAADL